MPAHNTQEPELTDEQKAALQQAAVEQMFVTPIALPVRWRVESVALDGDQNDLAPAVLLVIQTPVAVTKLVIERDGALALASDLRRQAQTGPQLAVPKSAGRLVVPGR